MKAILIVTNEADSHVDVILPLIEKNHKNVIRLNTNSIPMDLSFTQRISNSNQYSSIKILSSEKDFRFEEIQSIWWRRPEEYILPSNFSNEQRIFSEAELAQITHGIWNRLNCYWISKPSLIKGGSYKIEQLCRAKDFGFRIPKTIVTNKKVELEDFFLSCKESVIFKVFSDPFLGYTPSRLETDQFQVQINTVRTSLVTKRFIDEFSETEILPCFFQEYIKKAYELRITVINDEIFSAEIHSQDNEKTKIDWRDYTVQIPYKPARIPTGLAESILRFVRSYGLNYSALDFIVTPDGDYVFIENNPNGQFLFIEERVPSLKMAAKLVDTLINCPKCD
jgi:glutathione synthase/RimK-type ligase-like ATP-grasp enzyme